MMAISEPESVEVLLQQMVQYDTVNAAISGRPDAEAELAAWLESLAKRWGLSTQRLPVERHADQLLATWTVNNDAPWLLLDSHMDTVAVDGMTIDPFGGQIKNGRLYGRGACDTKGTGAAMLWALRRYAQSDRGPNNVALLFSVTEEVGMHGIRSFVENDYPNLNFVPRGMIVGEPTLLRPVVAHNGIVRWRITAHGVASHSAAPHLGRSAISAMARAILAIEQNYIAKLEANHPLTGKAVCSINLIQGGTQINIIPERCAIDVDRRLIPGEDPEMVLPAVEKVLDALHLDDPSLKFDQQIQSRASALDPASNEAFLPVVQRVLRNLGLPDQASGAPYGTHASALAEAGPPAIVIGPGDSKPAHTKDESVALEQIHRGVDLYLGLMRTELGG